MSIDAMNWVWRHSASKGTARMVLLAIANWCPDATATAYAGTTLLMKYTNASRSGVRAAIDKFGADLETVACRRLHNAPSILIGVASDVGQVCVRNIDHSVHALLRPAKCV